MNTKARGLDSAPLSRRAFLEAAGLTGLTLALPSSVACVAAPPSAKAAPPGPLDLPRTRPSDWDPIAFNRTRGNAGAIPESYLPKINGPDGATQHMGKHLPYLPTGPAAPRGMIAVMWGDPSRGYAMHPNARKSDKLPSGHWFDWIRVRRAVEGDAPEQESRYSDWPATTPSDSGRLAGFQGDDPAANEGRNTVYMVALPPDARPGDWVRVHGHCLTHGEYVEFVRLPG